MSPPLALEWRLVWPLCLGSNTGKVSPLAILPVNESAVLSDSVVPDDDGLILPLNTSLEVGTLRQMVVQELENGIGFLLLHSNNITSD